jgi:3-oxoacyl-[acyl-carrier-protein] synthase I
MIETWFLGAGLCSRLGLGLGASVEALRRPPAAPAPVESTLGGMTETIPTLFIDETFRTDPAGRFVRLADAAIAEALDASGLSRAQQARASLLLGTSSLDVSIGEHDYASALARGEDVHPLMTNSNMGEMGRRIARRHGLGGPDFTLNTACTASANALAYADALLRTGRAEHVLVVGVELFNRTTAFGFKSLELLSERGMRPFDRNRSGLVLGEACAALVVGRDKGAGSFRLRGSANMCDTHGVSAANPDGSTVAAVMASALENAKLSPPDILAVKAHGTASLLNDEAEAAGLQRIFGDRIPPVVALKPFMGHTFGACGLAELVAFCAAAEAGFLPGTPGVSPDAGDLGVSLTQGPTPVGRGDFLLNYFGFGGNNTSLVVSNG